MVYRHKGMTFYFNKVYICIFLTQFRKFKDNAKAIRTE